MSRLRLSNGTRIRRSRPFIKLCSFYGIDPGRDVQAGNDVEMTPYNELLQSAILDAWDGSEEHGEALLVVVRGLKRLRG